MSVNAASKLQTKVAAAETSLTRAALLFRFWHVKMLLLLKLIYYFALVYYIFGFFARDAEPNYATFRGKHIRYLYSILRFNL